MTAVLASPEKDAERRTSKDLPHLSLSLESPPSSSPFPSPSSSFVPPPMPGAHEYANKLPVPVSKKKQRESTDSSRSSPSTASAAVATTPLTAVASSVPVTDMNPSVTTNGTTKSKTTLSGSGIAKTSDESTTRSEETSSAAENIDAAEHMRDTREMRDLKRESLASASSLSSSRRAPPSPSVSRRTSGANNLNNVSTNTNYDNNNRNSVSLSRANSIAAAAGPTSASVSIPTAARRRSRGIKIRDFAYPAGDLRHTGQGPDAPRPGYSRPASQYGEDLANSSRRNSGWGAFRWAGSKLWGFALGNGSSGGGGTGKQRASVSTDSFTPTSSDFARNFDVSSPQEEQHSFSGFNGGADSENAHTYSEEEEEEEEELEVDDSRYPDQDSPLLPGLYRAMYAFVPEGTAEMALTEDQIVRIVGRGGGPGWAVAVDEEGKHALVPEGYLEVVQLDEEMEGSED